LADLMFVMQLHLLPDLRHALDRDISSEPNKCSGISRNDQTGVSWLIKEIPPFSIARPTSKRIMLVSYKKLTQTHVKKWM
jgi:hypothetical protein